MWPIGVYSSAEGWEGGKFVFSFRYHDVQDRRA
jgi:hypothetical protein